MPNKNWDVHVHLSSWVPCSDPMGPALVGLATGDIASMAYNMQVAFATTVVGMVIAAIGVVTLQIRQRWYAREINDLEFISKTLIHGTKQTSTQPE